MLFLDTPRIFQEENEGLISIGTLVAQIEIGTEHLFANNWIQEEFELELSGTESDALYDNGHEQNNIKVNDYITSINVYMRGLFDKYPC